MDQIFPSIFTVFDESEYDELKRSTEFIFSGELSEHCILDISLFSQSSMVIKNK